MAARHVHTPTVLQLEAVECGAASLKIILGYYGLILPLAQLRQECGVSRDGSKASNVVKAARRLGMQARGLKKEVAGLRELTMPLIIFWNFNHFLVVEGFDPKRERVFLNDPAAGHRTVSDTEFDQSYTGVVLDIRPGPDFKPGGREPSVIGGLWRQLRPSLPGVAFALLAGLLLVVPGVVIPAMTRLFVDEVLIGARLDWLRPLLLALLTLVGVQAALKALQLAVLRRLRTKLSAVMSTRFLMHLFKLPMGFYAQRFGGEIAHRVALNAKLAEVLSTRFAQTVIDAVMLLVYAGVMALYDPGLTAVVVVLAVVSFVTLQRMASSRAESNMRLANDRGKAAGSLISAFQSIENVKASGLEDAAFRRWAGYHAGASGAQAAMADGDRRLAVLNTVMGSTASGVVLIIGALQVLQGDMTLGTLVAFQLLVAQFMRPVSSLVAFGSVLQELGGDISRIEDVTSYPLPAAAEVADGSGERLSGEVELEGLAFGYSRVAPPIIADLNLHLVPGQSVALVGGSGSGKSTIGRLLVGLEEPWAGRIALDGTDRSQISRHVLAQGVAMVDQEITIFDGSLRENLSLWDPSVPDSALLRACQDAELMAVVRALPGGLDGHLLEGGVNLSGGQRQRVEIARALVHDPALLVLDEATSALDGETERLVVENIARRRCSTVVIAHRLSTIRDCDEIVVLDRGVVVERGSHDALLAQPEGRYRALVLREGGAL